MDAQALMLAVECFIFIMAAFVMGLAIGIVIRRKTEFIDGYHEAMKMRAESIIAFTEMYMKEKARRRKKDAAEEEGRGD